MTIPPGTGVCQGNFAATVKEILPINRVRSSSRSPTYVGQIIPRQLPRICGNSPLTGCCIWRN